MKRTQVARCFDGYKCHFAVRRLPACTQRAGCNIKAAFCNPEQWDRITYFAEKTRNQESLHIVRRFQRFTTLHAPFLQTHLNPTPDPEGQPT